MERDRIPETLRAILSDRLGDEAIELALASDLTSGGLFGQDWLIVTASRVYVFSDDGDGLDERLSIRIDDLADIEAVSLTGCSVLELKTEDGSQHAVYYSDAKSAEFHQALLAVKKLQKHESLTAADIATFAKRCRQCDRPIQAGHLRCMYCGKRHKTLLRMLTFSKKHMPQLLGIFLLTTASTLFGLITPQIVKVFIDSVFRDDPAGSGVYPLQHWHLPLIGLLFLVYAGQQLFAGLQERVSGVVGFRTVYDMRAAIYNKVQGLSMSFFDKHHTGAIMARINQDTGEVQRLLVDFVPMTLEAVCILIGVGILLFMMSWQLTLFVVIPIVGTLLFLRLVLPMVKSYFRRYFHRRSRLSALVNDSLSGMRIIKAFGQESFEIEKFERRSRRYRDSGIDLVRRWSLFHPVMHFMIMCGLITVWLVGGRLVFRNLMSIGAIVAYSQYLMMFYRPVFMLARMSETITSALSAAERVFDIIDTEPDVQDDPDCIGMPELKGEIELTNVTFGYDKHKPVLHDLSVKIAPQERIGLVGRSGVGKTTIINLVCRLYDVDEGEIRLDGIDIRKIRYSDLRRHIGVVLQDTFLFNGTVYDNIAYAKPDASREEIIRAAIAANAHDFIMSKPDAYDTEVGERGSHLSQGEKQRISIARGILRAPAILILDEATSSVDLQTETRIFEALSQLTQNRTTIAIAHRLSTLRNCHRLLVIENGEIAEMGTHEELMEKHGKFYELATAQADLSKIMGI